MKIHHRLLALLAGLSLMAAVSAPAHANGSFAATFGNAQGLPGSVVHPTITLPIDGFNFDSLQFDLSYDLSALSFLPAQTTVLYNGVSRNLTALPNYGAVTLAVSGNQLTQRFASLDFQGEAISGPMVLTTAFQILAAAPGAAHSVLVEGTVSSGPTLDLEEPAFAGAMLVSAVPEPEIWLLWISGLALVAARGKRTAARRLRATATGTNKVAAVPPMVPIT